MRKNRYEVQYGGFNNFTFAYEYEVNEYRSGSTKDENKYKIYYDKGLTSNLLLSSEIMISDRGSEEYRLDFFYTGFAGFNVNWKNTWIDRIKNYETELEVYTNDFYGMFDYSMSLKYSEQDKERFTLSFSLDYENFLKIGGRFGEKGSKFVQAGIDRVFDLKNVTKSLDTMDSSRVKVIAFVDGNDNNMYDPGEKLVDNVEVRLRDQVAVTNEKGEAIFYGVPNDTVMNLNPTIRKPSFSMGNNVIKIKGIATSTIEAYIPVKPMLTLTGQLDIAKSLKLSKEEAEALYNDILIKILDVRGLEIEVTMPDEEGRFMVSGIFPSSYYLELKYLGDKYKIPDFKEKVDLVYVDDSDMKLAMDRENEGERYSLNEKETEKKANEKYSLDKKEAEKYSLNTKEQQEKYSLGEKEVEKYSIEKKVSEKYSLNNKKQQEKYSLNEKEMEKYSLNKKGVEKYSLNKK